MLHVYRHRAQEGPKPLQLCSRQQKMLEYWTYGRSTCVTHTDWCTESSHARSRFKLQTNASVTENSTTAWYIHMYIFFFNSRCGVDQAPRFTVSFWLKIEDTAHTRQHNIRTHPGGLLQMVATQRVVQVEADHVAFRQTKVFAHCGCRVNVRGP